MKDKFLSFLGICAKAGQLSSGEFMVEKSVKEKRAKLVILAGDASENTTKTLTSLCHNHQTTAIIYGTKETLGQAVGKTYRASIAILDDGFAKGLLKQYQQ